MPSPYLPHAIYSVAIVSLSIHLVNQKKLATDQRARIAAQKSILFTIVQDLQSSRHFSETELERLKRLAARPVELNSIDQDGVATEPIGWKEIFLGRKKEDGLSKWDKKDMEQFKEGAEK